MKGKPNQLSAEELIRRLFHKLTHNFEILFSFPSLKTPAVKEPKVEAGSYYVQYNQVAIVRIENNRWALSLGKRFNNYSNQSYYCDIAAVPLDLEQNFTSNEEIEKIKETLEKNGDFQHSLIYILDNGGLAVDENSQFSKEVIHYLAPVIQEYEYIKNGRGGKIDASAAESPVYYYKPELVNFLHVLFLTLLAT